MNTNQLGRASRGSVPGRTGDPPGGSRASQKHTAKQGTGTSQRRLTSTANRQPQLNTPREHNSVLPVHQLPVEIFLDIVRLLLNEHPEGSWLGRIGSLSQVCETWKAAIEDSPPLWANISLEYGRLTIEKALNNSKTHPLCLLLDTTADTRLSPSELILLLLPHASRWEYFSYVGKNANGLEHLKDTAAPLLRTLAIELESSPRVPMKLFGGIPTTLQDLRITRLPLALDQPYHLNRLRDLWLHWTGAAAILPSALLHILSNNPKLSSLGISELADEPVGSNPPLVPVHLDNLTSLAIAAVSRQTLRQVLPNLIIPKCKSICIELDFPCQQHDRTSPSLDTTMKQTLQRVGEHMASWDLSRGTVELQILDHGEFTCEVDLDSPRPGEYQIKCYVASGIADYVATEFLPMVPNPRVKVTDIFFSIYGAEFTWLQAFRNLPAITSIEIHNEDYDPEDEDEPAWCFGEYIATPNQGVDEIWRWPFPGLERLHFEDDLDDQGILDAVAYRYQVDPSDFWKQVELPKPMKSIYMRNMDPGFCVAIKKIVGPNCIVYGSWSTLSDEEKEMSRTDCI